MNAREYVDTNFFKWLKMNKMIHEDHAIGYLTALYGKFYRVEGKLEDYAPQAAYRHYLTLNQNGLLPDEDGFIHAPRLWDQITEDHCTPEDSVAIWFQIFLERQPIEGRIEFCLPYQPSKFEHLLYLTPKGELGSVCVISASETRDITDRNKVLNPIERLRKSENPVLINKYMPFASDMREIFLAQDLFTADQIMSICEQQDILKGRPLLVLNEASVAGNIKRPHFVCRNIEAATEKTNHPVGI